MSGPKLILEVHLPGIYTEDLEEGIEAAMEWQDYDDDEKRAEFNALLEALSISDRLKVTLTCYGDKDTDMIPVEGVIIGGRLDEADR